MRPHLVDVKEIVMMLSARTALVIAALYGQGPRNKSRHIIGDVTGNPGNSLSIMLRHSGHNKPGDWKDFSTQEHGDILDLIACAKYGGDRKEAIRWAKGFLGIDRMDPSELKVQQRRAQEDKKRMEREAAADEEKRKRMARRLFVYDSTPDIIGTPVDHYLMSERQIDIRKLPSTGACHYAADCYYGATGELLPAMVLAIVGADGKICAVHRTYLEKVDGIWRVIREDGKALRMSLGPLSGGHVSVSKGLSGVPLGRAPQGDEVLIAEGYETACTYALACPDLRCVMAVSLGNMAAIAIPRTVTRRYLVKENFMDPKAERQFNDAVARHRNECADVRVIETPAGYSDANDVLRGKKKSA